MKLKTLERQKLKQLVADSILNRFTLDETIDYVDKRLGIKLAERTIQKYKQGLKEDMQTEFATLRRDKYAYVHEYLTRINEVKDLQRRNRDIFNKSDDDMMRQKCLIELHSLTLSLVNLYDLLPAITERSFYNNNATTSSYGSSPTSEEMDSGEAETEGSSSVPSVTK